jgi:hypothetical protein
MAARIGRAWSVFRPLHTARFAVSEGRPFAVSVAGIAVLAACVVVAVAGRRAWWPLGPAARVPLLAPLAVGPVNPPLFYGGPRFRIVAEPSIVVLAALGASSFRRRSTLGRRREAVVDPGAAE